jgi:hypothetical protein
VAYSLQSSLCKAEQCAQINKCNCKATQLLISEQEPIPQLDIMYRVRAGSQLPHEPTALGYIPLDAPQITSREGVSHYREILKQHVSSIIVLKMKTYKS